MVIFPVSTCQQPVLADFLIPAIISVAAYCLLDEVC